MFKFINLYYEQENMYSDKKKKVYSLDDNGLKRNFGLIEAIKYSIKFKLKFGFKYGS